MKEYLIQIIALMVANFIIKPNGYREQHERIVSVSVIRALTFFIITLLLHQFNNICYWSGYPALAIFFANVFMDNKSKSNITWFVFNQSLQLFCITLPLIIRDSNFINLENIQNALRWDQSVYLVLLSYLLCTSPSNIIIRIILNSYDKKDNGKIDSQKTNDSNKNSDGNQKSESKFKAGRLIGNVERLLTISLLYANQYEAIGFLIAAKSIIRTKDDQNESEYILIGTLLSFGIAITIGLIVDNIIMIL